MENRESEQLQLLSEAESGLRLQRIRRAMADRALDAVLISDNANIYYLTGRVFCGFIFIPADGEPLYAVRRPCHLKGRRTVAIHKVEELPPMAGLLHGATLGLEMGTSPYNAIARIQKAFGDRLKFADASPVMAAARSVKTDAEIEQIRISGVRQTALYHRIPRLFQPSMRDIDLQVEIERAARLEGCLGQFRISGDDMELFMGNVLVGDNADSPSPYDFAMGGAGMDPSLPVGADGTLITRGVSVMVDVNGNFTGYMTDMTRCYSIDSDLPRRAIDAHRLSIDICATLADMGRPGVEAKALYEKALSMATEAGFANEFMGHRQHAGFVGHGVGIEINELPVLAPRSKSILEAGNVIAIEPKFVIPGVGALGIENTYVVRPQGAMQCLTLAPQEITCFE